MKMILCAAVAVAIDIPDDDLAVGGPSAKGPLEELAVRLRREACYGRDCRATVFPGVSVGMIVAFHECPERN
jgi:hypothetical protein